MIIFLLLFFSKRWMTVSPIVMNMFSTQTTMLKISSFLPIYILSSALKIV